MRLTKYIKGYIEIQWNKYNTIKLAKYKLRLKCAISCKINKTKIYKGLNLGHLYTESLFK